MEHTVVTMRQTKHAQQVLNLLNEQGILRPSDLDSIGVPRVVLTRMTSAGLLEKVSRGLYRLPHSASSEYESLTTVAKRSPKAIFCLFTALQFHELTTQLPRQVWIAMPRGSHQPKIDYPPIKMVQFSGEAYSAGIEQVEYDQIQIRVYSMAKTIADCFKHRNTIGIDIALEALRDARAKDVSADELWRYAKICRVTNIMRPYLEATQ